MERNGSLLARWLFLRLLGLTGLVTFTTLFLQAPGLIGEQGLLPARAALHERLEVDGLTAILRHPSFFWFGATGDALRAGALLGGLASLALLLNLWPRWAALLLYLIYLSFSSADVGRYFFHWPPDVLIQEAAFLAVFYAPRGARPGLARERPVARWIPWMFVFLLFRLMFGCGLTKIAGGNEMWWSLNAVGHDHLTRPAPTPLAHVLYHLPSFLNRAATFVTLLLELVLPFLYLWPGRPRRYASFATLLLMVAFAAAGNYRTFNLATVLVTLPLLDDRAFRWIVPGPPRVASEERHSRKPKRSPWALPLIVFLTFTGTLQTYAAMYPGPLPEPWQTYRRTVEPYHLANGYALFARVQSERKVISIEVTHDGETWDPLEFHTNPGALDEPLTFVAPYHHFLDFLWWGLAYLSPADHPQVVANTARAILEGRPDVLGLFERVPFAADRPPLAVRFRLQRYEFGTAEERRAGVWWRREFLGEWCPPLRLSDGQLVPVAFPE